MAIGRAWYCGSVQYAAVPVWAASTAYTVGQFVRASAPTTVNQHVFRCTVAGTSGASEPSWALGVGTSTTVSGGATFTCVTGMAAYGWSAAAGNPGALTNIGTAAGVVGPYDTLFIASNSVCTLTVAHTVQASSNLTTNGLLATTSMISVNPAGSVPPVPADYQPGAIIETTGAVNINIVTSANMNFYGITFKSGNTISFASSLATSVAYLKDCQLWLNNASAGSRITNNNPINMVWDNVTVRFGNASQGITSAFGLYLEWKNTPNALAAGTTVPNFLFIPTNSVNNISLRGVDLSGMSSGSLVDNSLGQFPLKLFNCKLGAATIVPAITAYPGNILYPGVDIELVNCDSGATNYRNEKYIYGGSLTTDLTYYRSGGAAANGTPFSHKMETGAFSTGLDVLPLGSFPMYVPNSAVGSTKTITVELLCQEPVAPTLNPKDKGSTITLSNGNLTATWTAGNSLVRATGQGIRTGKWFWSATLNTVVTTNDMYFGLQRADSANASASVQFGCRCNNTIVGVTATGSASPPPAVAAGGIVDFAYDADAGLIWFRVNGGNWNNNALNNPTTGAGGYSIGLPELVGPLYPVIGSGTNTHQATFNFGASAFTYAPPSGFTALNAMDVTLKDNELYLEADYINSASFPDGRVATGDPLPFFNRTPVTIASSAASWSAGGSGLVPRKLAISFVPQMAGLIRVQLKMPTTNRVVYVDPYPLLT